MTNQKEDSTRQKILSAAKALIRDSAGDIQRVTTRRIAEKAGVAVGVVNYHFQTKENLLEQCVQQIIHTVIADYAPSYVADTPQAQLALNAQSVFDFLFDNSAVSRISILGDFQHPKSYDNTVKTMTGFGKSAAETEHKDLRIFMLVAAMQSAFLRQDTCPCGVDLHNAAQRDAFIRQLVQILFP